MSECDFDYEQCKYGYMRQKELMALIPFSAATLWRKVKNGSFIQPVRLSTRITAWKRADVNAWLEQREKQQ